ncbi:MAG TPA: hypothetical protein DDW52_04585 [Planctomycetaceae bacterium]|nr:hypothetical protein [Planctomycetaceae bacterium]
MLLAPESSVWLVPPAQRSGRNLLKQCVRSRQVHVYLDCELQTSFGTAYDFAGGARTVITGMVIYGNWLLLPK